MHLLIRNAAAVAAVATMAVVVVAEPEYGVPAEAAALVIQIQQCMMLFILLVLQEILHLLQLLK